MRPLINISIKDKGLERDLNRMFEDIYGKLSPLDRDIFLSPDGTKWKIAMSNSGSLTATKFS